MTVIPNAVNLVRQKGVPGPLQEQLSEHLEGLYRAGEAKLAGGATAGLYIAYLPEWQARSAEREKHRRRIAKALIEHQQQDARWLFVLLDSRGVSREAEFVLPRAREKTGVGTIRAAVNLGAPNRYHVEMLEGLVVDAQLSIPHLSARWNEAFSVERVTKRFYEEFRLLRDRIIAELIAQNPDNEALRGRDPKKDLALHAFGTRQLGRLLFLWFLQQKRWLGNTPGDGDGDFLLKAFKEKRDTPDSFYDDVLAPIFFDGLGLPRNDPRHRAVDERFGPVPFLGGGLFRAGADEFEAELFGLDENDTRTVRVALPDDLFDPDKDAQAAPKKGKAGDRTVLGLLRGYRFTTQESTPDDQSVDPDPELLGKVFENLYQEDERHETGAYYTPREIVHYMCRQALDGYLRERTGSTQEDIDWLRREAADWTQSDLRLDQVKAEELAAALRKVRILDPAVGSGAFLLAAIHEIVILRQGIVQAQHDRDISRTSIDIADWKRHAATHCVYGVDINPMAVEICQLRLLLSIVVDLVVSDFKDIPALPNLDFRIVAGDSLVDRMGEEPFFESLPKPDEHAVDLFLYGKTKELQKQVDGWREKFAGEGIAEGDARRLRDLRNKIRNGQVEIAQIQLEYARERATDNVSALKRSVKVTKKAIATAEVRVANLERLKAGLRQDAPYQKPFLWPVNFHEVFEEGGFDIVVANPPYVRMEHIDNIDEISFQHSFPDVGASRADLLVYFFARALQVARVGGQLAFITSNSFTKRNFGSRLCAFLGRTLRIREVIDFGESPIFDASVEPLVLIGERGPPAPEDMTRAHNLYPSLAKAAGRSSQERTREALGNLDALLDAEVSVIHQTRFVEGGWRIEDEEILDLLARKCAEGVTLKDFADGEIYMGVKTGLNEAFVVTRAQRDQLVAEDPGSADLLKPWLRGRDITAWKPEWSGQFVIYAHRGINIDLYPAVRSYLQAFQTKLERRATAAVHPWYELQQPQEGIRDGFVKPKIIWPNFARRIRFAFDNEGFFVNDKVYMWAGGPLWLVAVLNSNLARFLLSLLMNTIPGGFAELKPSYIGLFPIIKPGADEQKILESAALAGDASLANRATYALYDISDAEIAQIEEWFVRRSLVTVDDEVLDE